MAGLSLSTSREYRELYDMRFAFGDTPFVPEDLISDAAFDSYRAMLILLQRQEAQIQAMFETALENKKGFANIATMLMASRAAQDDVRFVLENHTKAKNAQADANQRKAA